MSSSSLPSAINDPIDAASLQAMEQAYLQSLLKGDRVQAQKLILDTFDRRFGDIRDIYLQVFQPSLYEIGRLWEIGQISIAQEHLATAITQSVLSALYARADLPSSLDQHAIVACLSGNYHEIGPRMLADFLQMAGYNTRFLGANTPEDCLLQMIEEIKPAVIGLPATTASQVEAVRLTIEHLRADFTSYRPIVMVGGLAFNLSQGLWKTVRADVWGENAGQAIDRLVGSVEGS